MDALGTKSALIVDGLSLDIRPEDLRTIFAPYGEVMSTVVVMDRYGRSLRYGYVVMGNAGDARKAVMASNGKMVGTQALLVAAADVLPVP